VFSSTELRNTAQLIDVVSVWRGTSLNIRQNVCLLRIYATVFFEGVENGICSCL
jgi:hypothetical protein